MNFGKLISIIAIVSCLGYFTSYARRLLAKEHDERFIIILEVLLVFIFTTGIMFLLTGKQDMINAVNKFKLKDLKLISISALSVSLLTILWIHIINMDELSKVQLLRRGLDLSFAIVGGYILLSEELTIRKVSAFLLLFLSAYLLSY